MPRPLRSSIREVFAASLLIGLAATLQDLSSPFQLVWGTLALVLLLGVTTTSILLHLAARRPHRARRAHLPHS